MNNFEKIGEFIKQKREDKGLTQDDLASKLGISKPTVSLYESGERKPTLDRLIELAKILDTPLSHFLALGSPEVDIDVALRAQGMSSEDVNRIKTYIQFVKETNAAKQNKSQK